MKSEMRLLAALILAVGIVGLPASPGRAQSAAGGVDELVPVEEATDEGIHYLSGGVGVEERENLRALAEKYNTKLVFALREGNYLALVDVVIADASGNPIVQTTTQGPWLFATLPEGAYTVDARMRGERINKRIEVKEGKMTQADFLW